MCVVHQVESGRRSDSVRSPPTGLTTLKPYVKNVACPQVPYTCTVALPCTSKAAPRSLTTLQKLMEVRKVSERMILVVQ